MVYVLMELYTVTPSYKRITFQKRVIEDIVAYTRTVVI
jgi:hypothetical protein